MDRVAVFVDAGYLFAQGSVLLTGKKQQRGDLTLDPTKVVEALTNVAESVAKLPLLRIYWYDGTSVGPTAQHIMMAHMPGVKIRLGFVNRAGEQKGVDSLIVTDMITLARNGGMSDAVLLSGDEDLRVGVQQAQEFGVRVHLLGIKPSRGSQSLFLLQEADTTHEWTDPEVSSFLKHSPRSAAAPTAPPLGTPPAPAAASPPVALAPEYVAVATELASTVDASLIESLVAGFKSAAQIPREFDTKLLARARRALGVDLDAKQKRALRSRFIAECETRLSSA